MSEQERAEVVGDLLAWAALTGNELPMPAEMIATIEAAGGIVDLCNGAITWDAADGLGAAIALTPAGWAALRAGSEVAL